MEPHVKLFAGSASQELGRKIAESFGKPLGNLSLQRFADNELGPSFDESI
ncbi:MAG: ribose-phosphate pyrophosphokinase, partial [Cytophagaceae bacterium]